ncbi:MAG: 4-hydroxy-tetrahydrodipicolinate synthase [Armatimonadetes bacterium]|nr:4-hydroxy-tetrahydrodipicolinate synthase [Armatimonadota bacterium]
MKIEGIIPAMVTPFTAEGEVDEAGLRALVRRLLAGGVHGLFPTGSTGEAYVLTHAERERVIAAVAEETAGRVPVMAGAGLPSTRESIRAARAAERAGADALSVIVPAFVPPSAEELYAHFAAIADSVSIPTLLYNHPLRTQITIPPEVVTRLTAAHNVIGIKDSSGQLALTMSYIAAGPAGFGVMAGMDSLILATLVMGGSGAVAASAGIFPEKVVAVYERYRAGDLEGARKAQYALHPLRQVFAMGTFPAVIKEALAQIGHPAGPVRGPAGPLGEADRRRLAAILARLREA